MPQSQPWLVHCKMKENSSLAASYIKEMSSYDAFFFFVMMHFFVMLPVVCLIHWSFGSLTREANQPVPLRLLRLQSCWKCLCPFFGHKMLTPGFLLDLCRSCLLLLCLCLIPLTQRQELGCQSALNLNEELTIVPLPFCRRLKNSFELHVNGITIAVNLLLGSEPSGRATVTTSSCSSHIRDVEVDIDGDLG